MMRIIDEEYGACIMLLRVEARRQHSAWPSSFCGSLWPAGSLSRSDDDPHEAAAGPASRRTPVPHRIRAPTVHNQRAPVMTLLLPSLQAERIRRSIVDYLSTTFALTDAEPRRVLADFLQDKEQGVFVGPFVRLRLPYLAASAPAASPSAPAASPSTASPANQTTPADSPLDWDPGLPPYQHQEDAYRRLTTKGGHRPEPTIVTTG
ncbi:hypothetical protein, partial [Schaalia odontolytica]